MASVKIKFRKSSVEGKEGTVYFRIIKGRVASRISTDIHIFPEEWDKGKSSVTLSHDPTRNAYLLNVREELLSNQTRISKIMKVLDSKKVAYTAADVISGYDAYVRQYSVFNYMENLISRLKDNRKIGTSLTYRSTLNSFRSFRGNADMLFDSITPETMESYESWLSRRGVTPNTISFYLRILRAVYNRVVEQDIIEDRRPFRHVYTGVGKTEKRALPINIIKRIKGLDLMSDPMLDYARDMFMLSFYLRGMSFVDMAFLKKEDLKKGYVTYRRRKTGKILTIAWTKEMQAIIDKYPENKTEYLLPILRDKGKNERFAYRNTACSINRSLKKIGGMLNVRVHLTMYVARHSWASAAKTKGVPLSVISEGMGHDSETTTRIYLASLETSVVDRANSLIISSL